MLKALWDIFCDFLGVVGFGILILILIALKFVPFISGGTDGASRLDPRDGDSSPES